MGSCGSPEIVVARIAYYETDVVLLNKCDSALDMRGGTGVDRISNVISDRTWRTRCCERIATVVGEGIPHRR
jgi:hypothetical protein